MEELNVDQSTEAQIAQKTDEYFRLSQTAAFQRTDRLFAYLMLAQWLVEIFAALTIAPNSWAGTFSSVHIHVWAALFLGGAISVFPVLLVFYRPGRASTRQVIAVAQMLSSALLIHLTGGRIETHFHVFGSLALLAFYRDWTIFPTATLVVGLDHLLRGLYFPLSVYGVAYASPWRSLEHAVWVLFESAFLVWSCKKSNEETREIARKRAELEALNHSIEIRVEERTGELSKAQEEIREREERLRTILYTAADAIVILDGKAEITTVNAAAEDLFGYSGEELMGKSIHLLVEESLKESMDQILMNVESSDERRTSYCALTALRKNGETLAMEVAISKMIIGTRRMFTIIMRDVTQRHMMELQLRQAQKLESIGQLAAGIAHEINTPIQYVGDNTRFLQDKFSNIKRLLDGCTKLIGAFKHGQAGPVMVEELGEMAKRVDALYLSEEIPRAIQQSLEGIARVTCIVKAMKEFSHPGTTEKQALDLNRAIESTVVVSTNEWKYVAEVEMKFDRELPFVSCLPGEFNQAMLNLIVNSAHAIADLKDRGPSGKGRITITTRNLGDRVEIRLQDTGTGIPTNVAHKIFDPFFTTKEVGKGTGQGLAITRTIIVNKHGGTIDFESEVGKGTTFILCLPIEEKMVVTSSQGQEVEPAVVGLH